MGRRQLRLVDGSARVRRERMDPPSLIRRILMRPNISSERLIALTDSVFAVIITIMVLELKPPDGADLPASRSSRRPCSASCSVSSMSPSRGSGSNGTNSSIQTGERTARPGYRRIGPKATFHDRTARATITR